MLTQIKYLLYILPIISWFSTFSQNLKIDENSTSKNSFKNSLKLASEAIRVNDPEKAIAYIALAKELSLGEQDSNYEAKTSRILSLLYLELGDIKNAENQINKAIILLKKDGDESELAYSYNTSGYIAVKNKKHDIAEKHLLEAEKLIKKIKIKDLGGLVKFNLGRLELSKNNPTSAIEHFNAALPIINSLDKEYHKGKLYVSKSKALLELNQPQKAIQTNKLAMEIAKEKGYSDILSEGYMLLSRIHERNKDYNKSLEYLKAHQKIKDSIFKSNKQIIALEAKMELNLDNNEILIEELTEENIQQQKSLKLGRLTTILAIALITILSLLTLSLYKNNNLRARANELLQNKNKELILAKESAERASEAKVQFLSTITHELRTPLYAVTGLTHLLLEESPTPNQKEHLNSLKFSGEYLLSLINNILDLNKLEAKKVEVENTSFNLKKRINDVLIALGKSAKDRNNKLHCEFDPNIPTKLKGDPLKISQVLINLIGNSIKFTQNGDIWIRVIKKNEINEKVYLSFTIEDNGVGISEQKQKSIFENFTQGSVQINRKFGGTGLGLSIVKNLLGLMGSEIRLESELGKGSKFLFDISFDVFKNPNKEYIGQIGEIDYKAMINKYVLIVEDNKINQLITRKILEKNKMKCDVADNGDIAINKARGQNFDLILMDIHMPGISGIEATKQIREFNSQIPIVALTAVTLDDNLDEFYQNGFDDIIPKPYKTEEFFLKLHKAFGKNTTPSTS